MVEADGDATAPSVSVVVPHYNDPVGLDRCLAAIGRQKLGNRAIEVIVADNGSPQGSAAVEAVIAGRARMVVAHEKGAGPARNAGVAASRAPVLAFTDADCVPEDGWLEAGVAALGGHDVVGGRMVVLVEGGRPKTGAEVFEQVFAFDNETYILEKGFSVSANLFCRRETFDAVGPFLGAISEDLDWCRRAIGKGFRLGYAAGAVVGHPARGDWPQLVAKWRRMSLETFVMAGPGLGGRVGWLARSWLLPLSVLAHAPRVLRSPALADGRERGSALLTLARIRLWRLADAHRLFVESLRGGPRRSG